MGDLMLLPSLELEKIFQNLPANSKQTYKTAINQFLTFQGIGINQLGSIKPSDILGYISHLKSQYSNATINLKIASLKSLFKKASVLLGIPNPFETLKQLKAKTTFTTIRSIRTCTLSETELAELLVYCKKHNFRNYCLIRLLAETGLRISEALSISFSDIKVANGTYTIRITGKGSKEREVFILPQLYQELSQLGSNHFTTSHNNRLTRASAYRIIRNLGKIVLGKSISPHTLRHSFLTNLIQHFPQKIKAISEYAGHSSTSTTLNLYLHNTLTQSDIQRLAVM
jgi:integrase/recombinase XerD